MNTGEMVAQVYRGVGIRTDDPIATKQSIIDALNDAQQRLAMEWDWPWLQASTTFNSVAGQATYATPADWSSTRRITTPNGDDLVYIDAGQQEDLDRLVTGCPESYAIDNDQIVLAPVPVSVLTYTHHYIRAVSDLVVDGDTSVFPAQYHLVLVAHAKAAALDLLGKLDRLAGANQEASQLDALMKRAERRQRGPMRARVRNGNFI